MPGQVRLTPPARRDLIRLRTWLSEAAGHERARAFIDRLLSHCERLAATPGAGALRPEFGPAVRSTVVPPYVIFYEAKSYGMRVLRIIHGNRDIDRVWHDES
jgi:toxin ParE1/3/4